MTIRGDDDIALAGEYVLGLLDAATDAAASARIATDAEFAAEVEAWRLRLLPLIDGSDSPAPAQTWAAIEAALPRPTGQDRSNGKLRIWQLIAGVSTTAAAAMAMVMMQQPATVIAPPPAAPLVAALGSETGQASLTARYDATSGKMLLTPVLLDTGALYPELWIVPADGQARSLGMVRADRPSEMNVDADMREFFDEGAILAITPEPEGGAPGGKATGPIIASGKITRV